MKKILFSVFIISLALGGSANAAKPFPAPTNLAANSVSSSQINLSWHDNTSNEAGFKIERSINGVNFSEIASVNANVTTYSNTNLNPNTTYYYKVRAYKIFKGVTTYSAYSNIASSTTFDVAPNAPTNLGGWSFSASSSPFVYLNWTDNSNNETGFSLERSTNGTDFNVLDLLPQNQTFYYDFNVTASSTYYYKISAYNNYGYSGYSNIFQIFTY